MDKNVAGKKNSRPPTLPMELVGGSYECSPSPEPPYPGHIYHKTQLKLLYNSLVLPHMDYCSAVWSNRYQSQTNQLRKVQKRAARFDYE